LGSGQILTVSNAIERVKRKMSYFVSKGNVETILFYNFQTMLNYLNTIQKQEKSLSNYQKAIKLFEIYRILKDNGLCENE
jgi:hypothetical protein